VSWNSSSGGSAVNFAYHLGVRNIVLIGFDMKPVNGRKNWHDDHDPTSSGVLGCYSSASEYMEDLFGRFASAFASIASDATELGIGIINCTPGSSLKSFPVMRLEEFIDGEDTWTSH
jgi:hypothetical protein